MKKYLLNTTSALSASIFSTTLLIAPVVKAEASDFYIYNPAAEISTKISHSRKIAEFNYMQPFFAGNNSLSILDLKLKLDNYQSKEINIGLAYRRNFNERFIFGAYTYFDHRNTRHDLSVSGVTTGVELLSKYVDARVNLYLPQRKRKKISHNSKQVLEIKGSSVYLLSGGHVYETSSKGYDVEIGMPLFGFSEDLNEKFGTKIYAAKYKFIAKGIQPINGTRFRITQNLLEYHCCQDSYNLYLTAETQADRVRRRQNFVGVGLKIAFNDRNNRNRRKAGSLNHRMMDTIVRDVDIVTSSAPEGIKTQVLYSDMNHHYDSRRIEIDSGAEIISAGVSEAEARALLPQVFNATNIPITIGGVTVYIDDNGKAGKPVSNIVVLKNGHVIAVDKKTSAALDRKKVALRKMQAFVHFYISRHFAAQAAAAQAAATTLQTLARGRQVRKNEAIENIEAVMNRLGVIDKYNEVLDKLRLLGDATAKISGVGFGRGYKEEEKVSPEKKIRPSPAKSTRSSSRSPKSTRSPSPQKLTITNAINLKRELGTLTTSINEFNTALASAQQKIGGVANKNLVGADSFANSLGTASGNINVISKTINQKTNTLDTSKNLKEAISKFGRLQKALGQINLDIRQHGVSRTPAAPRGMPGAAAEEE